MKGLLQDRRSFLLALAVLASVAYFAAGGRIANAPAPLNVPHTSVAEAKALVDAGALVLDVRSAEQYAQRHLPNAVFLPLDALREGIPQWLEASRDRAIVIYCNDGVGRGPAVTAKLHDAGFARAANLSAGIQGWTAASLPLVSG